MAGLPENDVDTTQMKISIVTVVFNGEQTIADAIKSVASQSHDNVEHIIVDGASNDGTMAVVKQHQRSLAHIVSEPDSGIYDAMNKGIQLATGEVIGVLNADDIYQNESVLSRVADVHTDDSLDACYGNLVYVDRDDMSKVTRYWRSQSHYAGLCFKGWMPAHPTLFVKRRVYEQVGLYNTALRYQADLEFCARAFDVHCIQSRYVDELWVRMRLGGVSNNSLKTMWQGNWESYYALKKLGLHTNPIWYFIRKFSAKLPQFFARS